MELVSIWRYPVKSMHGEERDTLQIGPFGLAEDRRYGVLDIDSGGIISAKRDGRLLQARAGVEGQVHLELPTGETLQGCGPATDAALTAWLGHPVSLVESSRVAPRHFESQSDFEDDDSGVATWDGPLGPFVDSSPVHLLTTASLRAMQRERPDLDWEVGRFRPNLLIEADGDRRVEDDWVGQRLKLGSVELEVIKPCQRCVMTTRAQPGGMERQLDILRHLHQGHAGNLGVLARVVTGGGVSLGQPLSVSAPIPG